MKLRAASIIAFALAAFAGAVASAAAMPFYPIVRSHVAVPAGVMPWDPSWSPDGRHILFQDYNGGFEWIADANGRGVRCLTCGMADHPAIVGGFAYVFPDDRRMFLANELGDSVFVLECAPALFDCRSHRWLPVDLSGDGAASEPNLGRRTYHLAPDGVHVGYTITRPDGLVMLVAALQRESADYRLVDYRVVNPPGPSGPLDGSPDGWANGGSLDELKSFADGGRSVLILQETIDGVPQQAKVDLATGRLTRLTSYPDWDEDGAVSPDGGSLLTASWRTQHRLTALGLMPLAPPFLTLAQAIVAIYYVSSRPGFSCDIEPWLLPGDGDRGGMLVGQPLNPYGGGNVVPANNLEGQQVWSPDSTRVLLQGRSLLPPPAAANSYLLQKGPAPNDLIVAHIERAPTRPQPVAVTQLGSWAPTPQQYRSSFDMPGTHVVNGRHSGTAVITIAGNIVGGAFSVLYDNYSDDGKYFLSGRQSVDGSVTAAVTISDDLRATDAAGHRAGFLKADLTFRQIEPAPPAGEPGVAKSGTISSGWLGKTGSGLPNVGACPDSMPRPSPLTLIPTARVVRGTALIVARVTADVYGDQRPVQGATVTIGHTRARTDSTGTATIRLRIGSLPPARRRRRRRRRVRITASAGDTFIATATTIWLRSG